MLRNTILSAVFAAAALVGLGSVPSAEAAPPIGHGRPAHFARYEVLVRHRGHWDRYGTYRDRADARQAARQLRLRGLAVRIERG